SALLAAPLLDQGKEKRRNDDSEELAGSGVERCDFAAAEIPNQYVVAELAEAGRRLGYTPRRIEPRSVAGGWAEVACRNTVQELPVRLTSYIPIPKTPRTEP